MKLFDPLIKILIDDSLRERFQQEGKDIKGFRGLLRVFPGHLHLLTLYNPLGLLAGVTFAASLFNPWWHASVREGRHSIDAYAFFLSHSLPHEGMKYIIEDIPSSGRDPAFGPIRVSLPRVLGEHYGWNEGKALCCIGRFADADLHRGILWNPAFRLP